MTVLIVMNQMDSVETLKNEIARLDKNVSVIGTYNSVAQTINWFQNNLPPDLIIMDIQLPDGPSHCIFKSCTITCPVIFCYSASDNIATDKFAYNGIDYLLKPIDSNRLGKAIKKYKNFQHHFIKTYSPLRDYFSKPETNGSSSRIVVKKGLDYHTVLTQDIVFFYLKKKVLFLVDKDGRKYLATETNLSVTAAKLDAQTFFRANRKYLINVNYLQRFNLVDKNKIRLEMLWPAEEEIIVSAEKGPHFRKWILNL